MEAKLFIFAAVAISEVFSACSPRETRFKNFQRNPRRSAKFTIGVASKKCPGLNEFHYEWQVQEIPGLIIVQSSADPYLIVDGYTYDSSKCFTKQYLVSVKVSHYPDMSYPDETGEIFAFLPDRMYVEILGGSEKSHIFGEDLIVNAKMLSKDPSYPPDEDSFAGNVIEWKIMPPIYNYTPPKTFILRIPGKYLKLIETYIFQISVTRNKIPGFIQTETAFQVIKMTTYTIPQLNVICMRNCIFPHPMDVVGYRVECIKFCSREGYYWWTNPYVEEENLNFGPGYDQMLLLENTFTSGTSVLVQVEGSGSKVLQRFTYISGLVKGNCSIQPEEGISSITKFVVRCQDFQSPYGVVLYLIYQIFSNEEILINEESYKDESEVFLAAGDPARLRIVVQDSAYLQVSITLTVHVKKFYPPENILVLSNVKKLVLSTDNDSITTYSIEGFHNEAVQLVSSLLDIIKENEEDRGVTRDLHKHMLYAIIRSHPIRYPSALQRMLILSRIEKFRLKDDTRTAKLIGQAMVDNALRIHMMHNHMGKYIPQYYINEMVRQNIALLVALLKESDESLNILNTEDPPLYYDSYDDFTSAKVQIRDDLRNVASNVLIALQTNCLTVLYKAIPDQSAHYFETDVIAVRTRRRLLRSLKNNLMIENFNVSTSRVYLTRTLVSELEKKSFYVDVQFGVFKINPFWWHRNGSSFKTEFVLFDLFIRCNKIRTLKTPFEVYLKHTSFPVRDFWDDLSDDQEIASYKVELEPHSLLVVEFLNAPPKFEPYIVSWSECICKETDFTSPRSKPIWRFTNSPSRTLYIRGREKLDYVYLCIKRMVPSLVFRFKYLMFGCLHWDIRAEEWSSRGCIVKQEQLLYEDYVICECTHVSLFTGQIMAPKVFLSLPTDINITLTNSKNYLPIAVIVGLLILWISSLILAHLRDKFMQKRNIVHKLDDNVPGDSHAYLMVVFTGAYFDANTTANVAFQLIGKRAKSRTHLMKCRNVILLRRNAQDWFTVYCPFYLGRLKKIRLWHNNKGKNPHWFCNRIIVQDLKTGEQYCFTVEKWFSVFWGGGKYYREIRVNEYNAKFRKVLFMTHLEKDVRHKHIWISVLARDFQSNFNSKERVSVGFCLLFLSMLVNAIFYGVPVGTPTDSIDNEGTYEVGFGSVIIYFESLLISTAAAILIGFIFSNSAPT